MKENKSEILLYVMILFWLIIFVIFMPTIEGIMSGRIKYDWEEDIEIPFIKELLEKSEKIPSSYVCSSIAEGNDIYNNSANVTFYLNKEGILEKSDMDIIYQYKDKNSYLQMKDAVIKNKNTSILGMETSYKFDDNNLLYTLIIKIDYLKFEDSTTTDENVTKTIISKTPKSYEEFKEYLSTSGLICSPKYSK